MEQRKCCACRSNGAGGRTGRRRRPSATEKLVAISLALLAVVSPLYVDRAPRAELAEDDTSGGRGAASWLLPLVLVLLILVVNFASLLDCRYTRFDPYWIHRVGGSSCGIAVLLLVLALVLKCKASMRG